MREGIEFKTELCYGCGACEASCPEGLIKMQSDALGFRIPVREQGCTQCGACETSCPILQHSKSVHDTLPEKRCFAFKAPNSMRRESTSGGLFQLTARMFIKNGGTVFGASLDENLHLRYTAAESDNELDGILKTKYIQADTSGLYEKVESTLKKGKPVLFCGTPCTTEAMLLYLAARFSPEELDRLLAMDMVCAGVPSPEVWKTYIDYLSEGSPLSKFEFRAKDRPDGGHTVAWTQNGVRRTQGFLENTWCRIYSKRIGLRETCYNCRFASKNRATDLTIGDFWGIQETAPGFDNGYGTSLAIAHTEKGLETLEKLLSLFPETQTLEVKEEDVKQPRLQEPPAKPLLQRFWQKDIKEGMHRTNPAGFFKKYGM